MDARAKAQVLIVEDENLVGQTIEKLLKAMGYSVVGQATTGREAVEMTQLLRPDVVLMDVGLPDMDGIEAIRRINESCPTPAVILTAHETLEIVERATAVGAGAYLVKPSEPQEMDRAITISIARFDDMMQLRRLNTELQVEICQRKRAEETLRESEERFRRLSEAAFEAIVIHEGGVVLSANDQYFEMFGYEPDELLGKLAFPLTVAPEARESMREQVVAGGRGPYESIGLRKDGAKFPVEIRVREMEYEGRKVRVGAIMDITERKRAEEALRESEEKYRNLVETSQDSIALIDLKGNVQFANKATEELTGYSMEEGIGMNVRQITPLRYWPKSLAMLRKARRGKPIPYFESVIKRKDGRLVPVESGGQAVFREGKLVGVQIITRDISERKRAEEALRASEERYRDLVEHSFDLICTHDLQGRLLWMNPAAEKIGGYTAEQLIGTNLRDYLAADVRGQFDDYLAEIEREGEASGLMRVVTRSGERRVWEYHNSLRVEGIRAPIVRGTARDITERKRAEEALRASERRFRALTENSADGIALVDAKGTIRYERPVDTQALGYSVGELVGTSAFELIHPDDIQSVSNLLATLIEKPETPFTFEFRFRHKDGSWRWLEASANNLLAEPAVQAIVVNYREITERKRAEEALRFSEERFDLAVRGSNAGIWDWNIQNHTLYWSPRLKELLGYADDELEIDWDSFESHLHPYDREPTAAAIEAHLKDRGLYEVEQRLRTKSGQYRWFRARGQALWDEAGNPLRMVGSTTDITERKRAEDEVKQRNVELATLLDVSRRLVGRLDLDELMDTVAYSIVEALPAAEAASLWLYDEQRNEMIARAWAGYDDEALAGLALSPDTSLVGLVYRSRQPHIIDDTAREPAFERLGRPAVDATRSVIGAPLMVEDKLLGALFADNFSRVQAFDGGDLRLLQSLVNQAAIALENAQLFEQVRASRQRLQTLSHRLVMVQEEERRHIAHELHDEVGQLLTGLNLTLDMSSRLPPDALRTSLGEAQTLVSELMLQVRNLSLELRPAMLDDLGLLAALLWHFKRYTAQTGVQVNFKHIGLEERRFSPEVETAAYRIVQEALTNVARYASVGEVTVHLRADQDVLDVLIEDQGAGFDAEAALAAGTSVGLAGMNERATLLGGQLTVESSPGAGACVRAELPLGDWLERRGKERKG